MKRVVGILVAVTFASVACAEDAAHLKSLSLEQLFELEVTSVSRKAEPLSRTAAAVFVVTGDELRRRGVLSVPEALRYVPGVEVARINARDYAITARGFNGSTANKLLVLIDGRSVYTPLYSGVFWDVQEVPIEDIEQIEVVRGPGATIWGANAVNGVINIITRSAAETQGALMVAGSGNSERALVGARYGGRLGSNTWFRVRAKQFDRGPAVLPNGTDSFDDSRLSLGGFRVDHSGEGRHDYALQGDLYEGPIDRLSGQTRVSGGNLVARWTRKSSDVSDLQAQAYFDRTFRRVPNSFAEWLSTGDLTVRQRWSPAGRHDVVWGVGLRLTVDDVEGTTGFTFLPEHLTQSLYSGFVQDEVTVVDQRLRLILGSKFEHNDYTGFEYQPSVRMAWTPAPSHTVWGAASRAVRTPSRVDHDLYAPASPPFILAGGPGFQSEIVKAFEVGYRGLAEGGVSTSVAAFYNLYDDLRSIDPTIVPITFRNGIEGEGYGVESTLDLQPLKGWRLGFGHTWMVLELREKPGNNDVGQTEQAGDSPRHQGFARSSMDFPRRITLDVGVRSSSAIPHQLIPPMTLWDGRLGWRPLEELELDVTGLSVFDHRHPEFGGPASRREIERSVIAKATWRY